MAKGTGIEIGATAVTVVEIDGSPKKFRVTAAARAPIEAAAQGDDRIKAVSHAARAALKAARVSKEQIVLSIPACDVIIREIQLPFTDEDQIRKVIKFESESHLHSCDIDDVVVGFQKIAESGPKSRVLVFAVKKDEIRNALDALDRIGIDPTHVTIDAAALFAAWRATPAGATDDGTHVILDVGDVTTTAIVTVGDRVRMVRGIRLGTETIAKAVASDLGVAPEEAEEVLDGSPLGHLALGAVDAEGDRGRRGGGRHGAVVRRAGENGASHGEVSPPPSSAASTSRATSSAVTGVRRTP